MVAQVRPLRVIGRYLVAEPIASGGMATVDLGRLMGEEGFSRTIALKRPHPHFASDSEFVRMFLDEARTLSRIRHPNVVAPLDVVVQDGELFIAMEYVHGETLSRLVAASGAAPPDIAAGIVMQVLFGLHAAHEALGEGGQPLHVVHRDVSPQNILVGEDGVAKVVDFGIARALLREHTTEAGLLKGKLGYMAPEQLSFQPVDRRTDLYATGIVLWELVTGKRLFASDNAEEARTKMLGGDVPKPSSVVPSLPPELDSLLAQSLARDPNDRFQNARAMAGALGQVVHPASVLDVGAWVERTVGPVLAARAEKIIDLEMVSKSDLTLTRPLVAVGEAPLAEGPRAPSMPPPRETRGRLEHTGLSMAPSSFTRDAERRKSRARIWMSGVVTATAIVATLLVVGARRPEERVTRPARAAAPPALPSATAMNRVPSRVPVTTQDPVAPAASSGAPAAGAVSTDVVASAAQSAAKPASTSPKHHGAPVACNPPYSIDAEGIKHFKPECFK